MATIKEIISPQTRTASEIINDLKKKTVEVPRWDGKDGLVNEYEPKKHPVMNKSIYPDVVQDNGTIDYVTRVTYDMQRLAVKRMTELCNGIPVKRVYRPENERQKEVAKYLEKIFQRNRIDSVNIDRCNMLFASCEVFTLWYAVEQENTLYGFNSKLKLRCRSYSPMNGDELYPLFDEYGDMIALSIGYTRKINRKNLQYFDTYTADHHYKWMCTSGKEWELLEAEEITLMKIPGIYAMRPTPIWEDQSKSVYEMEWSMSRNGNYLRKNSKPIFCVFADEEVNYGSEKNENEEARSVAQFPKGSTAGYVTWAQAIENLKFYISELRQSFFTQLQLPDWSYESMKANPMSGESRKQLFIDAQLKVKDESGRLIEFYDREVNVLKAFLKVMLGDTWSADIDALPVEIVITPFTINDEKETVENLTTANGGRPIMSHRESIEEYGHSDDVDKTLEEIRQDSLLDVMAE